MAERGRGPPAADRRRANDGAGLILVVEKFPEANTLEVTRERRGRDREPGSPACPASTFDTSFYRPAAYIEESIDNLRSRCIIGGVLLAASLALLLFNWRAALIAIVVIPLSLVVAGLVLELLGQTLNAMVVAGLVGCARPARLRRDNRRRRRRATPARAPKDGGGRLHV